MIFKIKISSMSQILQDWSVAARGRRELRQMSDHLLKDIGLSRAEADRESNRPFWDLGKHRDATQRRYQGSEKSACCMNDCCQAC